MLFVMLTHFIKILHRFWVEYDTLGRVALPGDLCAPSITPLSPQPLPRFDGEGLDPQLAEVLDLTSLERVYQYDAGARGEILCELVALFLQLAPKRLAQMNKALQSKDWHALSREAHSLKSSSSNMGAVRLSRACRRLEGVENHPPEAEVAHTFLVEVEKEYHKASSALCVLLKNNQLARKQSA